MMHPEPRRASTNADQAARLHAAMLALRDRTERFGWFGEWHLAVLVQDGVIQQFTTTEARSHRPPKP